MKFKVLRGTALGGGRDAHPGEVIELSEADARPFVLRGRLQPLEGEVVYPTKGGMVTTEALVQNQSPKRTRKG